MSPLLALPLSATGGTEGNSALTADVSGLYFNEEGRLHGSVPVPVEQPCWTESLNNRTLLSVSERLPRTHWISIKEMSIRKE